MTGKLLQFLGVAVILAMLGATIAGFAVLKDRVRIVVQSDEARIGPDPTALLRDDVAVLGEQLQGLQQAVASNFEQLAGGLEQGARARAQTADADRAARHEELRTELRTLARQVAALQQRLDAEPAAAAIDEPTEPLVEAAATESAAIDPSPAEPLADESPRPEPESAPEPEPTPAEPARTGFLSFSLPQAKRVFDEPQTYRLLPDLCRVGFDAKSTLHDFTGVTTDVEGSFRADFDDPDGLCTGEVTARAGTLVTGVEGRDDNMYEHLDTANHPQIRFAIDRFVADQAGVDVDARTASGTVVGSMSIRGKSRELSMPIAVEVDAQQRLVVTGQTKLKLSDYEVPVPNQLGVIKVEDEVTIWIALRARPQGDAK